MKPDETRKVSRGQVIQGFASHGKCLDFLQIAIESYWKVSVGEW
jgi:hypothetical protein